MIMEVELKDIKCIMNCGNSALMRIANQWYCGECIHKWHQNKEKRFQEDFKNGIKNLPEL